MVWLARSVPRLSSPNSASASSAGGPTENGARFVEKHPVRLGQDDAATDPVEQDDPVARLKRRDRRARRGMGNVEIFRRAGHMLAFGDPDANSKLFQRQ